MFKQFTMALLDVVDTPYNYQRKQGVKLSIWNSVWEYRKYRVEGKSVQYSLLKAFVTLILQDILLNGCINILFFGMFAGRSPFPLFLGNLDREISDSPLLKPFDVDPSKILTPLLTAQSPDRVICDGEYLLLRNSVPIIKMVFLLFTVSFGGMALYISPLGSFIEELFPRGAYFWFLLLIYVLFSLIPERSFVLFDRRKKRVTFYRGWLRRVITLHYSEIEFTYTNNDSTTGDKVLAVVAKKRFPWILGKIKGYSGAIRMNETAGVIDYFMKGRGLHTLPSPLYNSIMYHREFGETLWRYSWFKKPRAEERKRYDDPKSLYQTELIDPYLPHFSFGLTPEEFKRQGEVQEEQLKRQESDERERVEFHRIAELMYKSLLERSELPVAEEFIHIRELLFFVLLLTIFDWAVTVEQSAPRGSELSGDITARIENYQHASGVEALRTLTEEFVHDITIEDSLYCGVRNSFPLMNSRWHEQYHSIFTQKLSRDSLMKTIHSEITLQEMRRCFSYSYKPLKDGGNI